MMTIAEAIDYINAHTWSQWKLGLSRTEELLRLLGDPQKSLRFVHVAGSNGKGSTCAMVERILREAGYRTGFYPSPYIEDFRERIQVCGKYITEEALCRITARVRDAADSMEDHPSQFEIITAIGLVYFKEKKCDLVVLEVGLGGIFDSTNVIDAPEVAVITNIGLEHTEYLGNTLAEIARNKCGIIKSGADVVCYENVPEVMDVVRHVCAEKGCPLHIAHYGRIRPVEKSLEGQTFYYLAEEGGETSPLFCEEEPLCLALLGEYQLHNTVTALTIVEALRGRGWSIPQKAVREGLAGVQWPARFEVLSRHPLFILDGGHNPQCAEALAESLGEYLPDSRICRADGKDTVEKKAVFLMGMLADKDYHAVIDIISPFAAGFVCLTPDSPRALPAEKLAAELEERGFSARPCGTAAEGIETALCLAEEYLEENFPAEESRVEESRAEKSLAENSPAEESFSKESHAGQDTGRALPVVAFGSLYMAGHVRSVFSSVLQKHLVLSKKKQRKAALQRRRALTAAERAGKSAEICRILASMPQLQEAETILSYAATWDEADPWEINCLLQARGKTVCYPLTEENGRMTAVIPGAKGAALKEQPAQERESDQGGQPALERKSDRGEQPALERESDQKEQPAQERESAGHFSDSAIWKTGVYGIREPVKELALEVDPSRIDAVIVPCVVFDKRGGRCGHGAGYYDRFLTKVKPSAAKILIAFDAQESGEVPMEKTDIRMDFAVTESGLIAFGAGARPLTPCF